jgi:sigma-B regulation protein RsbU (phosphoserine phosphatase)
MSAAEPEVMSCMEVWGGNQPVDSGVVMAGLDAWVYSRPFGESSAGGDVYYVSSCATGRITRLLVADVSGHGGAVAELAVELRRLMRKYVNHIEQTRFVKSMNEQFTELSAAGVFATAIVTTFFAPTRQLSLCNAGHPPPLWYRASTKQWCFLSDSGGESCATNIPLGILDITDYQQFDARLDIGDLVLAYTDSLIESRDSDGEMFGAEGLLNLVRGVDCAECATFVPRVLEEIARRFEGNLHGDDVTVMLFRPNGRGERVALKDKVLAPLRVMKGVAESLVKAERATPWPEISLANLGGAIAGFLNKLGRRRMEP